MRRLILHHFYMASICKACVLTLSTGGGEKNDAKLSAVCIRGYPKTFRPVAARLSSLLTVMKRRTIAGTEPIERTLLGSWGTICYRYGLGNMENTTQLTLTNFFNSNWSGAHTGEPWTRGYT